MAAEGEMPARDALLQTLPERWVDVFRYLEAAGWSPNYDFLWLRINAHQAEFLAYLNAIFPEQGV